MTPHTYEPTGFEKAQRVVRIVAAFLSPGIVGIVIIICVLVGEPPGTQLTDSEIVSSVALFVGAALVLGSIALYQRSPESYDRHQLNSAEQIQAIADLVAAKLASAPVIEQSSAPELTTGAEAANDGH